MDDYADSMSIFQEKIAIAQANGDRWVETTPEIIRTIRPRGLGEHNGLPVEHFCYHGILVCEKGKSQAIEAKMNEPLNNKMHGSMEARVISGN